MLVYTTGPFTSIAVTNTIYQSSVIVDTEADPATNFAIKFSSSGRRVVSRILDGSDENVRAGIAVDGRLLGVDV